MLSSMMTVSVTLTPRGALNSVEVGESRLEGFINFLNYRDDTGERHKHLTLKKNSRHVKGTGKLFEALKITKVNEIKTGSAGTRKGPLPRMCCKITRITSDYQGEVICVL